ncbi:MAG: YncE family protein, partial [Candidatus Binatia bacterium]
MRTSRRSFIASFLVGGGAVLAASSRAQPAMPNMAKMPMPTTQGTVKVPDPTKVVMIVNRDSNEIAFMDIASRQMVGKTFLGNNSNPHMVMMSPDGRYVVTGGTRSNAAYIIDSRTLELVKKINVGIGPEHLSFSPDSR